VGALDNIDSFSTYDDVSADDFDDEEPRRAGPGRPVRRFLPQRAGGIDAAFDHF
jgi:hypothetical protein